jgi:leucyl-tRNA synthetase
MEEAKSTRRRDFLKELEDKAQALWTNDRVYEADPDPSRAKYFLTFPYPYMNGRLHLGHAYSFSKCEFTARYQRLLGKNVLLPFGFHCTGMPIPACADKLKREITHDLPEKHQWRTLKDMGVQEEEIPKFTEAEYWLKYFPPRAKADLYSFGVAVDWRRSFITTQLNPYYDAFVRWQFNTLNKAGKVYFGKRYTIYSIRDGQPCADHDRLSGEGVGPQEYTLIKIEVIAPFNGPLHPLEGKRVFLVAATLRPETMYGQTNCFILPEGDYGAFEMKGGEVFVCTERSMKNMAYQGLTQEFGVYNKLLDLKGTDLLGLPLKAPLAQYDVVYSLPMPTISMDKATGVVTSVPSDAPDDYAMLKDLQTKAVIREQYGITPEMVNFNVVPIINIPEFGDMAAVTVYEQLKIKSHKDKKLLTEAKDKVYLKGFTDGIMLIGSQQGQKVSIAKPIVRQEMIDAGLALPYFEPEKTVISRSGDECIVALCDQWVIKYGEQSWKEQVLEHVKTNFSAYFDNVYREFLNTLDWLSDWACSRIYGLGTKLPWDDKYVVESLSDSTIYMAYYTVAHLLQGGDIEGHTTGPAGITPDQLTDSVWDYIFGKAAEYPETNIPKENLDKLRTEFLYWYPLNLRCSGKDLIRNHLTMSLYNHAAVWNSSDFMPRSFFCNGYGLLNGAKMSKSTGNFMTLNDSLVKYGADATRIGLADAGDTLEDANFQEETSNAAILKLYTLYRLISETLKSLDTLRTGEKNFFDHMFENTLNSSIEKAKVEYERMVFREALKISFFDLNASREEYNILAGTLHRDVFLRYVEVQALILSPITPHFCEGIWELLNEALGTPRGLLVNQEWPRPTEEVSKVWLRRNQFMQNVLHNARLSHEKTRGKKNDQPLAKKLIIYVAHEYPELQRKVLGLLDSAYSEQGSEDTKKLLEKIKTESSIPKSDMQKSMQFASFILNDFKERGREAFEQTVPFNEFEVLSNLENYIKRELSLTDLAIHPSTEAHPEDSSSARLQAQPGKPLFYFYN